MKNKILQGLPTAVVIGALVIIATITIVDSKTEREAEQQRLTECEPIIAEFERIQAVRNDKRLRFEGLLAKQEQGLIPFDNQGVDYEYRSWMVQETELDRLGDDLIQDMRLLRCDSK